MTIKTFAELVNNSYYLHKHAMETIHDDRGGMADTLRQSPEHIHSRIASYAQGWMKASHQIQWAVWMFKELEAVALLAVEENISCDNEAWFEDHALRIQKMFAQEAITQIFRGTDNSSNPMTIINSAQQVEAAKKALETFTWLREYNPIRTQEMDVLMELELQNEAKREAIRAATIVRIQVSKRERSDGGGYLAVAENDTGKALKVAHWRDITKKTEAKGAAAAWMESLKESNTVSNYCRVEVL